MAKVIGYKKPRNIKKTLKTMLRYFKRHIFALCLVTVMVIISAGANIYGTYLLKPIVNDYIVPGDIPGLIKMLLFMGTMYLTGVLCTFGYTQLMVRTAQAMVKEIRSDLFSKTQNLPLSYFEIGRAHV